MILKVTFQIAIVFSYAITLYQSGDLYFPKRKSFFKAERASAYKTRVQTALITYQ